MEQQIVTLGVAAVFLLGVVFGLWLSYWSERTLRQEDNKGRIMFSMPADRAESAQLLRAFAELAETRIEREKDRNAELTGADRRPG